MKQNNKGFFLAETIVMLALVTTVMAFVYPNLAKLYENNIYITKYYDQISDLSILNYAKGYYEDNIINETKKNGVAGTKVINSLTPINNKMQGMNPFYIQELNKFYGTNKYNDSNFKYSLALDNGAQIYLYKIYIVSYMASPKSDDPDFNRYLNRIKKSSYDSASYRLIGEFLFINNEFESNNCKVDPNYTSEPKCYKKIKDVTKRYASIKIDNPNPDRNENLGG